MLFYVVKYKWHSVGSNSCYACTRWNGQTFSSIEDVPEVPVHPNCECYIEVIDPEMVKLEHAGKELASSKTSVKKEMSFDETMKDGQSDLEANEHGRNVGRKHPAGSMEEFLNRYRPEGLDDKY